MDSLPVFYRMGQYIYKRHWVIIFLWLAVIVSCLPFLPYLMEPFKTVGFVDETSASVKADTFLENKLGYGKDRIIVSFSSTSLKTTDPLFLKKIKNALSNLSKLPMEHEIIYPSTKNKQFSKNEHHAVAIVLLKTKESLTETQLAHFKSLIKSTPPLTFVLGGEPIFIEDVNKQTAEDLYKADIIAAPVSIIIMILVFGSLVAASIPIILGGCCAIVILTSLFFLGQTLSLSIFTINISLLLGLCLSLDYSLFIISRFKEELNNGIPIEQVIAVTMNHAGKAIFFSGLAVFISLSALLMFPISILFSIGIGGLAAVFFAVLFSIILLPAVLCVLKNKVNRFSIKGFGKQNGWHFWRWLAEKVVKRPLVFFFPSLIILLLLSMPFLKASFGVSDADILPEHTQSRKFLDTYKKNFNEYNLSPLVLIATNKKYSILSENSLSDLSSLTKKIKALPSASEVKSIVNIDKKITISQYHTLYTLKDKDKSKEVKQLLKTTTGKNFTTISLVSKFPSNSKETKQLIKELKQLTSYKSFTLQVTGVPVNNVEVMNKIWELFPYAVLWILALTYLILLFLLRSLILPLKAIFMNIISLSASYGVLVFVFQEGYFHQLLNFVPQGMLDTSLLIIIFCALFGFSMDYEVFLLTRMKECHERTKDTNRSVIAGLDQSGRIITSAAVIVIVLCGSFMAAQVLMVKEFGLGIAVAIFVDAFLVRSLLVPSIMVLLQNWNWYLPKWLDRILPEFSEKEIKNIKRKQ